MIYDGALERPGLPPFSQASGATGGQKILLIVDNLRVRKAKLVTAWVEANNDRIELFDLPAYAPEHNPDESINNDAKQPIARRRPYATQRKPEMMPI